MVEDGSVEEQSQRKERLFGWKPVVINPSSVMKSREEIVTGGIINQNKSMMVEDGSVRRSFRGRSGSLAGNLW
ncbi:hypothetical protein AMTR_s00022p00230130 [Amborella trichopoda]|uniref:Uncharacterized protein n=1 Tax=Amborella trichopoda TaxID=13333 RepID=W1PUI2_AMBTC|nr:hypothetical protein AMTR_s00022p00230130 [Amborella trichopoda]